MFRVRYTTYDETNSCFGTQLSPWLHLSRHLKSAIFPCFCFSIRSSRPLVIFLSEQKKFNINDFTGELRLPFLRRTELNIYSAWPVKTLQPYKNDLSPPTWHQTVTKIMKKNKTSNWKTIVALTRSVLNSYINQDYFTTNTDLSEVSTSEK